MAMVGKFFPKSCVWNGRGGVRIAPTRGGKFSNLPIRKSSQVNRQVGKLATTLGRRAMATPEGTVRVQQQDKRVWVQVTGWGRMQQALPLRRFAEQCLAQGADSIRIDLRQCTYLDSTFLGTLLHL